MQFRGGGMGEQVYEKDNRVRLQHRIVQRCRASGCSQRVDIGVAVQFLCAAAPKVCCLSLHWSLLSRVYISFVTRASL